MSEKKRMCKRKQVLTRIIVMAIVALLFCSFSVEDVSANTKTRYGRGALGEVMEYTNHLPAVHPLITGNEVTVFYSNSPSSIKLNKSTAIIKVKGTLTLKATVSGKKGTVKWKSSNSSVATVSSKGKVTGNKKGTATITASLNGAKATCKVTVTIPVSKVTLNKTSASVAKGKTITLKAAVSPSNAVKKNIKWTSSNAKVATVSSKGVVKGIAKGTATITAAATDGSGKRATCKVTVKTAASSVPNVTDSVLKKTAVEAAKSLNLTKKVSEYNPEIEVYEYYYIRKGKRLHDGSPSLYCPTTKPAHAGDWDITIGDSSIAFQGIKVGMSESSVKKILGKKWRYEYKYSYDQNEYGLSFSRNLNYSWSWLDRVQLSVTFNKKTGKVKFIDYYTDQRD